MLSRHCYHLNLPLVIITGEEDISCYDRLYIGGEGKNDLQRRLVYFDESVFEYKYILKHFCFEYKVTLLKFLSVDLNR